MADNMAGLTPEETNLVNEVIGEMTPFIPRKKITWVPKVDRRRKGSFLIKCRCSAPSYQIVINYSDFEDIKNKYNQILEIYFFWRKKTNEVEYVVDFIRDGVDAESVRHLIPMDPPLAMPLPRDEDAAFESRVTRVINDTNTFQLARSVYATWRSGCPSIIGIDPHFCDVPKCQVKRLNSKSRQSFAALWCYVNVRDTIMWCTRSVRALQNISIFVRSATFRILIGTETAEVSVEVAVDKPDARSADWMASDRKRNSVRALHAATPRIELLAKAALNQSRINRMAKKRSNRPFDMYED